MNIKFKDDLLFKQLLEASLVKIRIGSHMYNLNDENSDEDYLCIYVPSRNEKNSFSFTNHQLQYQTNNIDYNFVNIFNFLRNCINGDSTINFEVINSEELLNTPLSFLYNMREAFNNYMIIRSYLGLARRDAKHITLGNNDREKNKTLIHTYRGYYFAKNIFENNFSNILDSEKYNQLVEFKNISDYKIRFDKIKVITEEIDNFRALLNSELDKGGLVRFMKVENQQTLDNNLQELVNSQIYKNKEFDYMDMSMIYDANENGVKY